ncbi:MAG: hypothetical protein AB1782_15770, partial [Cyanobacteriota bacterium]
MFQSNILENFSNRKYHKTPSIINPQIRGNNFDLQNIKPLTTDSFQPSFKGSENLSPEELKINSLSKALIIKPDNKKLKQQLLDQERLLMEQELIDTEQHLKRMFRTAGIHPQYSKIPKNYNDILTLAKRNALTGLSCYYYYLEDYGYKTNLDADLYYPIFKAIIEDYPDNSYLAEDIKTQVMINTKFMYRLMNNSEDQEKFEKLGLYLINNSPYESCKKAALNFFIDFVDKDRPIINETQKYYYQQWLNSNKNKASNLRILGKLSAPQLETILPDIINRPEKQNFDLLLTAIWCAGRVQSDKCFNSLKSFIYSTTLNNHSKLNKKQLQLSEMALYSLFEHRNNHKEETDKILQQINAKIPQLTDISQDLQYKSSRNFSQKDSYLKSEIPSGYDRSRYKNIRKTFVTNLNYLTAKQINYLDKGILPLRELIAAMNKFSAELEIINDTVTSKYTKLIGTRTGDGRFYDM